MSNDEHTPEKTVDGYTPPKGATSSHTLRFPDGTSVDYVARADWMPIYNKRQKPIAEIFHVAYVDASERASGGVGERPLTFVFNGGPGAASAYLHMGAVGPRRVVFNEDGSPAAPPATTVDNTESWLEFTDLVFVDPVGTGFSRGLDPDETSGSAGGGSNGGSKSAGGGSGSGAGGDTGSGAGKDPDQEFFGLTRDLESLCEFMRSFLARHNRWESPVFVAGESYGGFRVAKLVRMLQERYSIGLNGAVLISPALEFSLLDASDYDILPWVDTFPTMALAAAAHEKHHASSANGSGDDAVATVRNVAERFALNSLPQLLASGRVMPGPERDELYATISTYIGISEEIVKANEGRVRTRTFSRELLREQRRVLGLYDATISVVDAYPDRDSYEGPDATLSTIDRVFGAGVNTQLRRVIGVQTDREYKLLSYDVNKSWKVDYDRHVLQTQIGATDDLRYGIQLNPYMHVRISHGIYDLVTPYFASERIAANMKLDRAAAERVSLRHYTGGHMFYSWNSSRAAFSADMKQFYADSTHGD